VSSYGVVLLHNTSSVMRAEKLLQKSGVAVKLIPTPRELSSDCGLSVRFALADIERVRAMLDQAHVDVAGIHAI
jgi:hypothetical protein